MTERLCVLAIAIVFAFIGEGLASMAVMAGYGIGEAVAIREATTTKIEKE